MQRRNSSEREKLIGIFVRSKTVKMLLAIRNKNEENRYNYCGKLAAEVHCTYSHALSLLEKMRGAGLLTFEKSGRTKNVELTAKGIEVSKNLKKLIDSLELL